MKRVALDKEQVNLKRLAQRVGDHSARENARLESTLSDGLTSADFTFPFNPSNATDIEIAVFLDQLSLKHPWRVADALRGIAYAKGIKRTNQLLLDQLLADK